VSSTSYAAPASGASTATPGAFANDQKPRGGYFPLYRELWDEPTLRDVAKTANGRSVVVALASLAQYDAHERPVSR
jgi:hypothetical protein